MIFFACFLYNKYRKAGYNMGKKGKTVAAILGGAAIGAGLGILFAPKSGKETRAELKAKMDDLISKAKEIDMDDVRAYVVQKTEEIEAALKDLDKEKVLKIAKKKAKDIQKAATDLVNYVKEKGEPVLTDAAEAVRLKAIDVTKNVLEKLENPKTAAKEA